MLELDNEWMARDWENNHISCGPRFQQEKKPLRSDVQTEGARPPNFGPTDHEPGEMLGWYAIYILI